MFLGFASTGRRIPEVHAQAQSFGVSGCRVAGFMVCGESPRHMADFETRACIVRPQTLDPKPEIQTAVEDF